MLLVFSLTVGGLGIFSFLRLRPPPLLAALREPSSPHSASKVPGMGIRVSARAFQSPNLT